MKRQRRDGEASDRRTEEEEERLAEEKLKQLQELAEKSLTEKRNGTQPSSSSSSSKACLKSSWQQISNLMLYTAAGVKGSDKVGPLSTALFIHITSRVTYTLLRW